MNGWNGTEQDRMQRSTGGSVPRYGMLEDLIEEDGSGDEARFEAEWEAFEARLDAMADEDDGGEDQERHVPLS